MIKFEAGIRALEKVCCADPEEIGNTELRLER